MCSCAMESTNMYCVIIVLEVQEFVCSDNFRSVGVLNYKLFINIYHRHRFKFHLRHAFFVKSDYLGSCIVLLLRCLFGKSLVLYTLHQRFMIHVYMYGYFTRSSNIHDVCVNTRKCTHTMCHRLLVKYETEYVYLSYIRPFLLPQKSN